MTIRVVVVDDQGMVRSGLISLLTAEPDIDVVAEAADGDAAVQAVLDMQPDVVLMDIRLPGLDGLAATRQLAKRNSPSRVLILTTFDLDEHLFGALSAGASGFLLKDSPAEVLVHAVRLLAAGEALLDPGVTRRVIEAVAARRRWYDRQGSQLQSLTKREIEVLRLAARGFSNAEIAAELFISDATAKTHVSSLLSKLGSRDRVHLVIYAYENGLVQPGLDWLPAARPPPGWPGRPGRSPPPGGRPAPTTPGPPRGRWSCRCRPPPPMDAVAAAAQVVDHAALLDAQVPAMVGPSTASTSAPPTVSATAQTTAPAVEVERRAVRPSGQPRRANSASTSLAPGRSPGRPCRSRRPRCPRRRRARPPAARTRRRWGRPSAGGLGPPGWTRWGSPERLVWWWKAAPTKPSAFTATAPAWPLRARQATTS